MAAVAYALYLNQIDDDMLKSVKITEEAHQAVQLAKSLEGIKVSEWMSVVILEAVEKEFPEVATILRDRITKEATGPHAIDD